MTPDPISCEVCFNLMEEYRRDMLTPGEKEKFLTHIEQCATCAEDLRLADNLGLIIGSDNDVRGQSPDFAAIRKRAKEEFTNDIPDNPPLTEGERNILHSENRFSSRHIGMVAATVLIAGGWYFYGKSQMAEQPQIDTTIAQLSGPAVHDFTNSNAQKESQPEISFQEPPVSSDGPASAVDDKTMPALEEEISNHPYIPPHSAARVRQAEAPALKSSPPTASFAETAPASVMSATRSLARESVSFSGALDQSVSTKPLAESFRKEILRRAEEHRAQNENAAAIELYKTARGENKDRIAATALLALAKLSLETNPEQARSYLEKLNDADFAGHLTAEEKTERDNLLQSLTK